MKDPRYPVGKFEPKGEFSSALRKELIQQIADTPVHLRAAVKGLSDKQLDTRYREGGWTIRQVTHHLPDSHLNSYVRFKLGMTEEQPTIKPYKENLWAELAEAKTAPVEISLVLLESLHKRWVLFLKSMNHADFARTINHPESGIQKLEYFLRLYAWHGRHHVAQITSLRERMGW